MSVNKVSVLETVGRIWDIACDCLHVKLVQFSRTCICLNVFATQWHSCFFHKATQYLIRIYLKTEGSCRGGFQGNYKRDGRNEEWCDSPRYPEPIENQLLLCFSQNRYIICIWFAQRATGAVYVVSIKIILVEPGAAQHLLKFINSK